MVFFSKHIINSKTLLLIFFVLIAGGILYVFGSTKLLKSEVLHNNCTALSGPATLDCYMESAVNIAKSRGIVASLEYVHEDVLKNSVYQIVHLVLHGVGHEAYHRTHDVERSMGFIALFYAKEPPEFSYTLDGYRHGVFQAFFDENKANRTIQELMQESCFKYFHIARVEDMRSDQRIPAEQCFHAVGHAVLYAYDNNIDKALVGCEVLPHSWMQNWCFYGVFMEYSYLYWPFWMHEKPMPSMPESMTILCDRVHVNQRDACSRMVGRAYFSKGGLMGALKQCALVEERHRRNCVIETAAPLVPSVYKNNFKKMVNVCREVGSELGSTYEGACIYGVASGIKMGSAGFSYREEPFCNLVEDKFQDDCLRATGRNYTFFDSK